MSLVSDMMDLSSEGPPSLSLSYRNGQDHLFLLQLADSESDTAVCNVVIQVCEGFPPICGFHTSCSDYVCLLRTPPCYTWPVFCTSLRSMSSHDSETWF